MECGAGRPQCTKTRVNSACGRTDRRSDGERRRGCCPSVQGITSGGVRIGSLRVHDPLPTLNILLAPSEHSD